MARRERTTGLPAPRRRVHKPGEGRRIAGINWTDRHSRWSILAAAAVVLFVVVGFIVYRWYDATFETPNRVVLQVGNEKVKLSYYTDRLYQYLIDQKPQSAGDVPLIEQQLLTQLQQESLTMELAQQKGIKISDNDITSEIASELGVPVGGQGSSFDTLYREKLKTTKMSDANYRRMAEATLANKKLLDYYTKQEPATGELVTLQSVVLSTQDAAKTSLSEVKAGQDLGTVAQKESTDLTSKQNNGLMAATPPKLLPQAVQDAIKGKQPGDTLFGPLQVDNDWWVFKINRDDAKSAYTDSQKQQLAQQDLTSALDAAAKNTKISRNLTNDDLTWASNHAND